MSSAISGAQSASEIQTNYLNLLITQLQNQNPLDPMDNSQMAMNLAQLSELSQLETMSGSFAKTLTLQQVDQASSMLGKQVAYFVDGESNPRFGIVSAVQLDKGQPTLQVGSDLVDPSAVVGIANAPPASTTPATTTPAATTPTTPTQTPATQPATPDDQGTGGTGSTGSSGDPTQPIVAQNVAPAAAAMAYANSSYDPMTFDAQTDSVTTIAGV